MKRALLLLALVIAFTAPFQATAADAPPDDVMQAAKEGVKIHFKDRRHDHQYTYLGLNNQDELDNVELGEGFQLFTIPDNALLDGPAPQNFQSIVTPTNEWNFFVMSKHKYRAVLEVSVDEGKWTAGAIGSSRIAKEMSGFLERWPASSGYTFRFIRVYLKEDVIELSLDGKILGIIPLTQLIVIPERAIGVFKPSDLRNPEDMLTELQGHR